MLDAAYPDLSSDEKLTWALTIEAAGWKAHLDQLEDTKAAQQQYAQLSERILPALQEFTRLPEDIALAIYKELGPEGDLKISRVQSAKWREIKETPSYREYVAARRRNWVLGVAALVLALWLFW